LLLAKLIRLPNWMCLPSYSPRCARPITALARVARPRVKERRKGVKGIAGNARLEVSLYL